MKIWVLEKIWFDRYGYTRSACYSLMNECRAKSVMVDDWHEEYISRGLHSPPDDNVSPFKDDTDATLELPNDSGRIEWHVHETDTEERDGECDRDSGGREDRHA